MIVGCFALIEPFSPMKRQFEAIKEMGFDYPEVAGKENILESAARLQKWAA